MSESATFNSDEGKRTVDSLMAKMSPEQREQFQKSLQANDPVHVHVDKEGNILLGEAADAAAPVQGKPVEGEVVQAAPEAQTELKKDEPKKPNKIELKRQQIYMDRVKRKMGETNKDGSPKTPKQAQQEIAREDYEALSPDKKIERLESLVSEALQNLGSDIMNLNQGQMAIGDAFDINYRAIQKMFIKLGMTPDEQKSFIDEAQKEVIDARKAAMDKEASDRMAATRARQAASEAAKMSAELKAAETPSTSAAAVPEGAALPVEATVFGG